MAKDKKKRKSAEATPQEKPVEVTSAVEDVTDTLEPAVVETEPEEQIPVRKEDPFHDDPELLELIIESYEGETKDACLHGNGVAVFMGGNRYEGDFLDGMMSGLGVYTWTDGIVYHGEFQSNRISGHGRYMWLDESYYEGDVWNGRRHGQGTFRVPSINLTYRGHWENGKPNGHGIAYYDDDSLSFYEGEWSRGLRNGFGVRRYMSGNVYEGQWKAGRRHGRGTMRWLAADEEYVGQWEAGVQSGQGEHTWYLRRVPGSQYAARNQYVGVWRVGKRHGFGEFRYASGARYQGDWVDNEKHGRGIFTFKNGRTYTGVFHKDRMLEYPEFEIVGDQTPDISEIRTRTPLPPSESEQIDPDSMALSIALDVQDIFPDTSRVDLDTTLEVGQVQKAILRNINQLKKIYNIYAAIGHGVNIDNTFVMTRLQLWRLLKDCRVHRLGDATLPQMDRCLSRSRPASHDPDDKLLFRDFVDALVRISYLVDPCHPSPVLSNCFSQLVHRNILKYASKVGGNFLGETRRAVIALGYIDDCWNIFRSVCDSNPRFVSRRDEYAISCRGFLWMMSELRLVSDRLSSRDILGILSADDPKLYDPDDGVCNLEFDLSFLEFFEALLGCAVKLVTEEVIENPETPRPSTVESRVAIGQSSPRPNQSQPEVEVDEKSEPSKLSVRSEQIKDASPTVSASRSKSLGKGKESSLKLDVDEKASKSSGKKSRRASKSVAAAASKEPKPPESMPEVEEEPMVEFEPSEVVEPAGSDTVPDRPTEPEVALDDIDEETKQFNFWTHQLHVFFVMKFYKAAKHLDDIRENVLKERQRVVELERETFVEKRMDERTAHLLKSLMVNPESDNELVNSERDADDATPEPESAPTVLDQQPSN